MCILPFEPQTGRELLLCLWKLPNFRRVMYCVDWLSSYTNKGIWLDFFSQHNYIFRFLNYLTPQKWRKETVYGGDKRSQIITFAKEPAGSGPYSLSSPISGPCLETLVGIIFLDLRLVSMLFSESGVTKVNHNAVLRVECLITIKVCV